MEVNTNKQNVYFANLDVLRFLAAFMVVMVHAYEGWCGWFGYPQFMTQNDDGKTLTGIGQSISNFIKNGMFGVDIFFLISGFLITYILLKEKETTGKIDIKKFFIRRGLRIWPLYFLIVALAPLLIHWLGKQPPHYQSTVLFYNNFHTMITGNWEYPFAHYWSICIEEHFYLIWPFLVAFIPNKHLLNVFWSVVIISIVARFGFTITGKGFYYIYLHTLSKMDVLAIGAIGAYYYHTDSFRFTLSKYVRLCIYGLFLIVYFYEPFIIYDGIFLACFRNYFYIGVAIIAMTNFLFNPDALIKIQKKTFFHYLGKISFGIYMYSNVIVPIIIEKIIIPSNYINMYFYFFLNIALSIIISIISFEFFEKQILKFKTKYEVVKTNR